MYQILTILITAFVLQFTAPVAYAADCTIIYGGGEMDCSKQNATTPTTTPANSANSVNQTQTKGGAPIYKQTEASTTPATGPDMLGLIGLIPAATAGLWLRRKTNKPVRG